VAVPQSDGVIHRRRARACSKHHRGTTKEQYAGIDVLLESSSVCVVDATARVIREAKIASEPEALVGWFHQLCVELARIGLEADPLSQWLHAGMRDAGIAVERLETRHVHDAFKAMPVKTDRKDARGIAQVAGPGHRPAGRALLLQATRAGTCK
jgi:transposase